MDQTFFYSGGKKEQTINKKTPKSKQPIFVFFYKIGQQLEVYFFPPGVEKSLLLLALG